MLIGFYFNAMPRFLRPRYGMHQHIDIHNFSEHKYSWGPQSKVYPADVMAAPLRKISLDYHQTLRRVRFQATSDVPLRLHRDNPVILSHIPETPSDRNTLSSHTAPSSAVSAEVHDDYLSFLSRRSYPPGLYTAIAHDGPLRTRIQCFWSELDEFWWHLRRARHLLFGWLATLYHLILLVGYTFSTNSVTSVVLLTRRMRRTMSLRYVVMVWLLPVLDKIRNSALEAVGTEGFSKDIGGPPVRSDSEGNGVAVGIPIPVDHAQVGNGGKSTDIFRSERVLATVSDHPASTTNDFSTRTRTYSPPTDYHALAASITFLKARLGELDRTVNALEKSLSGRSL